MTTEPRDHARDSEPASPEDDRLEDDRSAVSGELVDPPGEGRWEPAATAHAPLGISQKTLYRRIERGMLASRKNAYGRIEVWVATASPGRPEPAGHERGLAAFDITEAFSLAVVEELRRQHRETLDMVERQTERLGELHQRLGAAEAGRALADARVAELEAHLRELGAASVRTGRLEALRAWWRFWVLGQPSAVRPPSAPR